MQFKKYLMQFKKILVTGVNGQVGHALQQAFTKHAVDIVALDRSQLDLTDLSAIRRVVQNIEPDLIINPAAYTAVDKAESEPELAYAINATAPQALAEQAAKLNARLIHFSTDYVYAGNKQGVYIESDPTQPLSIYGKSKLAGEEAIRATGIPHLIFRTSWVYGAYGKNFMNTILRLAAERDELRVVADQFGAPTSSNSIAQAVLTAIDTWQQQTGTYHLVNFGETSWHGFAQAIVEEYAKLAMLPSLKVSAQHIHAITTQDYPTPAVRPANSRLHCEKLKQDFGVTLADWRVALIAELQLLHAQH
jgi:dTDP-4-dehydrorhamnose reductase